MYHILMYPNRKVCAVVLEEDTGRPELLLIEINSYISLLTCLGSQDLRLIHTILGFF